MTDLEKALQAGAEDITDYDRAVQGGAREIPSGTPNMMRQPKSFSASDVDLGIESPLQGTGPLGFALSGPGAKDATTGNMLDVAPTEQEIQAGSDFFKKHGRAMDPMEADPMAQSVALTAVLGPLGRLAAGALASRIGALPAGAAAGAGEAALGAKSAGGDVADAAKFGGLFGAIGGAASARPSAVAAARNDAQMVKDVKRGATKAPKSMADEVDFSAERLAESSRDLPEVRKALVTRSRSNPVAAEATVSKARRADVAANDAVYDAIEQYHGGLDLRLVTDRLANLEAKFHVDGNMVAKEATGRLLDKLNSHYGGNAGGTLTAAQLRNIRNDLGDVAFPGIAKEARPSAAKGAIRDAYDEFNAAIEEVAALTPGVDVGALRSRNQRISSLGPAEDALGERAALEADRELGVFKTVKDKVKKGATGINRRLRYRGERTGGGGADNPLLMGIPAVGAARNAEELPSPAAALGARYLIGQP